MAKEINIERVIEKILYLVVEKLKRLDKYYMTVEKTYNGAEQIEPEKCDTHGEWVRWSDIEKIIKELEE